MYLQVLEGKTIDGKQVRCAICRVAIFTLKDLAEKVVALILSSN
jgi:hypothetical protein